MSFLGALAFILFTLYVCVMGLYLACLILPAVLRVVWAIVAPFTVYPLVALCCFAFAGLCRCLLWLLELIFPKQPA